MVLIGAPKNDAPEITAAADVSAEKPCTASRLKILWPIVLIIFQPPVAVPMAMHKAQVIWTHSGTVMSGILCPMKSASVIMPMVF